MKKANSFLFLSEGFKPVLMIAIFAIMMILFTDQLLLSMTTLFILAVTLFLFRNPERILEHFESAAIISVCDGIVSNIETLECSGKIKGECLKITVVNRMIDTAVLRAPFNGTFALNNTKRGVQLALHSGKAMTLNEQSKIMFVQDKNEENKMVVKHYLNRFNLPLAIYPTVGDRVEAGSSYGFILHGTINIFVPASVRLDIKRGDELKAGETALGYFYN